MSNEKKQPNENETAESDELDEESLDQVSGGVVCVQNVTKPVASTINFTKDAEFGQFGQSVQSKTVKGS